MSSKAWIALGLLVPAVILERMAYYATRSMMFVHFAERGLSTLEAAKLLGLATTVGYFVSLLGGGLALLIGPRATAAIGALVAALGLTVLAAGGGPEPGIFLLAIGAGIFRPCPIAAAAEIFAAEDVGPSGATLAPNPRRFAMIAAFTIFMYAGINLGSVVAPWIGSTLRSARGAGAAFGVGAAMDAVVLLLVGGSAIVSFIGQRSTRDAIPTNDPYRTQAAVAPEGQAAKPPNALAGVALLAIPMAVYGLAVSLASSFPTSMMFRSTLHVINPVVVVLASLVLAGLWLAAAIGRWTLTPLRVWGIGFAIFGVGLVPMALGMRSEGIVTLFMLGSGITAVGEAAVSPMTTTYAAVAVRPRAAALVIAAFSLLSWLSYSAAAVVGEAGQTAVLMTSGVLCLVVGMLAAIRAPSIHDRFFGTSAPVAPR